MAEFSGSSRPSRRAKAAASGISAPENVSRPNRGIPSDRPASRENCGSFAPCGNWAEASLRCSCSIPKRTPSPACRRSSARLVCPVSAHGSMAATSNCGALRPLSRTPDTMAGRSVVSGAVSVITGTVGVSPGTASFKRLPASRARVMARVPVPGSRDPCRSSCPAWTSSEPTGPSCSVMV